MNDIRISLLGEYYFNELLTMPEYLYYIKDDVYLEHTESFDDAFSVYKKYSSSKYFWKNFKNIGKFLFEYGKLEIKHLQCFKSYNTFDRYNTVFNAGSHKMFSFLIISGLEEYAKHPLYSKKMNRYLEFQTFDSTDLNPLYETKSKLDELYKEKISTEL